MGEPNILLTRIDNRLIHGQVATQWNGTLGANLILVANDKVAKDKVRQGLMDMAAPAGVQTRYFSLQKPSRSFIKHRQNKRFSWWLKIRKMR